MKIRNLAIAAGTLALGLATLITPTKAQGPMYDVVYVTLPYTVTIADKTLQPGDYMIKEIPSQNKSRVLGIYSDKGMHLETTAMTIAAQKVQTPEDTTVVLHHFGPDYYFDKIFITGKNYGYEFPLPDSVKARQREELAPVSVAARYEASPVAANTTATASAATSNATSPAARNTTSPAATNNTTSAANRNTTSPAATNTTSPAATNTTSPAATNRTTSAANQSASPANNNNTTLAQNTSPTNNSANREASQANGGNGDRLPNTSAGWLMMLLSGGALSGAGMTLRRKLQ